MSKIGRRYRLVAVAAAILIAAVTVAALYGAWQVAVIALALLVSMSLGISLETRFRHGASSAALLSLERSLTHIRSALVENKTANQRTAELIRAVQGDASERATRMEEAIRRDIHASAARIETTHERTRDALSSVRRETVAQVSRAQDAILGDIKNTRKLDGERHARSRKLLSEVVRLGTETREQAAQSLSAAGIRERRVLGVLEAERLRSDDRHRELLARWERDGSHGGE